jgi:hypothetical protein
MSGTAARRRRPVLNPTSEMNAGEDSPIPSEKGTQMMSISEFVERYFELDLPVIPETPATARPPRGWDAVRTQWSTDSALRTAWWRERIYDGVLLPLGHLSGLVIVESLGIDGHCALLDQFGALPATVAVSTGVPDQYHIQWLFKLPAGIVANARPRLGSKLMLRAEGENALLPPSLHPSGSRFAFLPGKAVWEIAIADLPELIVNLIRIHKLAKGFIARAAAAENECSPVGDCV